ncbi:MAG: hypothetical protein ACKOFW_20695, partial [Planctomycetaceae bacterium]
MSASAEVLVTLCTYNERANLESLIPEIWRQAPEAGPRICRLSLGRVFGERRLPFFLPSIQGGQFPLFYQAEHSPNPESRVLLSTHNLDDLGTPR